MWMSLGPTKFSQNRMAVCVDVQILENFQVRQLEVQK